MPELVARSLGRFIMLVLVQVLVMNNIELGGYVNPFIYVMFILFLPLDIPGLALLALSFAMGITIDMFSDTSGMHAAASVFIAFCRPYLLRAIAPRDGYEAEKLPVVRHLGLNWFLTYSSILVFLHHFVLFYLETFRFSEFFSTFFRVIASSMLSITLILLIQYVFYYRRRDDK